MHYTKMSFIFALMLVLSVFACGGTGGGGGEMAGEGSGTGLGRLFGNDTRDSEGTDSGLATLDGEGPNDTPSQPGPTDDPTVGQDGEPAGDSTAPNCNDACGHIDGCGILSQFDMAVEECVLYCEVEATQEDVDILLGFTCDELQWLVSGNGSAPEECQQFCGHLDECGYLSAAEVSNDECVDFCGTDMAPEDAAYFSSLSCNEIWEMADSGSEPHKR